MMSSEGPITNLWIGEVFRHFNAQARNDCLSKWYPLLKINQLFPLLEFHGQLLNLFISHQSWLLEYIRFFILLMYDFHGLIMMRQEVGHDVGRRSPRHHTGNTNFHLFTVLGCRMHHRWFKVSMNCRGIDFGPLCPKIPLWKFNQYLQKFNKNIEYWVQYTDCISHCLKWTFELCSQNCHAPNALKLIEDQKRRKSNFGFFQKPMKTPYSVIKESAMLLCAWLGLVEDKVESII